MIGRILRYPPMNHILMKSPPLEFGKICNLLLASVKQQRFCHCHSVTFLSSCKSVGLFLSRPEPELLLLPLKDLGAVL